MGYRIFAAGDSNEWALGDAICITEVDERWLISIFTKAGDETAAINRSFVLMTRRQLVATLDGGGQFSKISLSNAGNAAQ